MDLLKSSTICSMRSVDIVNDDHVFDDVFSFFFWVSLLPAIAIYKEIIIRLILTTVPQFRCRP